MFGMRAEMEQSSFLLMEAEQPLCLACAGFGDLEFLAAGDTALTRRAMKYSERTVVVVRFSRSWKRYERRGVLVESAALDKAERECVEDADERATARTRGPSGGANRTASWLFVCRNRSGHCFQAVRPTNSLSSQNTLQ